MSTTNKLGMTLLTAAQASKEVTVNEALQMADAQFAAAPRYVRPCRVATTANITLSGAQTIDGVAVVAGDEVLVKNQATPGQNGIWVCASGAWTRRTDFDAASSIEIAYAVRVEVTAGTVSAGLVYEMRTGGSLTIGTTGLVFSVVDAVRYHHQPWRSGKYYSFQNSYGGGIYGGTACACTNGEYVALPVDCPTPVPLDRLYLYITTLAGAGKARGGIYSDSLGYPDQLISGSDAAEFDTSTTGAKTTTIALTLPAGFYWYTYQFNNSTNLVEGTSFEAAQLTIGESDPHSTGRPTAWRVAGTYGAMPASFPGGASGSGFQTGILWSRRT